MIILLLIVGFVIFQMYQGGGKTWKSMKEVEEYLSKCTPSTGPDVHSYDVLGPF